MKMTDYSPIPRKPEWLKIKIPKAQVHKHVNGLMLSNRLHTICESGNCPNAGDCWSRGTATFMILGDICTRACKFCNVKTGRPLPPDPEEPQKVAESIRQLGLRHCVITSVDRDDLPDSGAAHWVATIQSIKKLNPGVTMEVLIPDFDGKHELVQQIIDAQPEVISHNLETVERLTSQVRSRAKYRTSLKVLEQVALSGLVAKSGIMLGLGETREEIVKTMDDLRVVNCKVMTLGQYLQPTRDHHPVKEYIHPDIFAEYERMGLQKGFSFVESSPLVRSSYKADQHVNA
ncbi:MAG: lipoyl synthase [Bacteroidetes bacterium GWE2_40_63]|jgi:lipoic acid synthetase|nr:MAG: lipoyl synthase [Bacteroidetes bacterium GWA2_40_14]OFX65145.1 MAG: lipoyl synthase [Bacteroidetes bacterium GWC2_40_13]OFX74321.1 MAG: lipoyl synthase [Bacteroidetes bacterium GWD2_40_43]OFX90944.1 MAG: lipoyl synthase [Bacteroidetes bacterium GWE2_40_63]OFY21158.1 MAG: lipoyl synthase [Bacteroidetes bacterium GWF2_40_13]OFZ25364.1 MAG: lipoyl synthase [Bacteroidetes bacterium RIFOXYC2_FULL_40_12]